MKLKFITPLLAGITITACNSSSHTDDKQNIINVADAIENPSPVTTSKLGSTIKYVPLETSDTCLIAGGTIMSATPDKIIVSNFGSEPAILVFDLHTGKFLNRVGQHGNGPEDFNNPYHVADAEGNRIYVRSPNGKGMLAYTTEGEYTGKILPELNVWDYGYITFSDSVVTIATHPKENGNRAGGIMHYTLSGERIDSMGIFNGQKYKQPFPTGFTGYTDYKRFPGLLGYQDQTLVQVTNQDKTYICPSIRQYNVNGETHIKEVLCDTVYRLTSQGAEPVLIFDMGANSFPVEDMNARPIGSSTLLVTDMLETKDQVIFGLSRGWPINEDHSEFIGLYDRATGKTIISPASEGIADDLSGFMPFRPSMTNSRGDLIGVLTPEEIETWFEEHPDTPRPEWLDNIKIDDNPVLVIITK
ncbi:MAG: DUF4934 domain-containing protein [Paramuribaculum sp.]|nr:DUF4934 domain-containing protein [Paramuribaculum sp.]